MVIRRAKRDQSPASRSPQWFEQFNPRGGVPRESLPGFRRAAAAAAAIFDPALVLLDEPPSEIDLASALAVLGSTDDGSVEYDDEEAQAVARELPILLGTIDWTPEEAGDLLAVVLDAEARGGIVPDDDIRARISERVAHFVDAPRASPPAHHARSAHATPSLYPRGNPISAQSPGSRTEQPA